MQTQHRSTGNKSGYILNLFSGIVLLMASSVSFAAPVVITGNTVITTPTVYKNATLDLTNGRFTVDTGGSLKIEDSTINATISAANPFMITLKNGEVMLKQNSVNVNSSSITPTPTAKADYQLLEVQKGTISLLNNNFVNNTAFTVQLLGTKAFKTFGTAVMKNTIKNFHGGLFFINSHNAEVAGNTFENVSFYNIFNNGDYNIYADNIFSFPGNLVIGDAIDIVNSKNVEFKDNIIASGASYGIYLMGVDNVVIDNNKITDGMSYAIYIETSSLKAIAKNKLVEHFVTVNNVKLMDNSNITISNNFIAQNRYGLAGGVAGRLLVTDNIFIQRFPDSSMRQYWTNNNVLLPQVADLVWKNNFYKEAFTQEVPGDNSNALQFVNFPKNGGVYLP